MGFIMLWLLLLFALVSCSHPFRDVSCTGEAPYSPADTWDFECRGWNQSQVEDVGVTVEDYSQEKTLTELMDLALRTNPTTKHFWAQARADAYAYEQSKAPFYPRVDTYYRFNAISEGTDFKDDISSVHHHYRIWTREMNISWLLFDFGGREFNMMAFKMAMFSSDWVHAQAIQDVMNKVLSSYYAFLESQALAKAKELDVKDSEVNVEVAQVRFEAGLGTKVDVLRAESTLSNTKLELEQLQGRARIDLGKLATALGLPANSPLTLKDLPSQLPLLKNTRSLDELIAIAKIARADLNALQANYQRNYYEYQGALARFWPKLVSNYNWQRHTWAGHHTIERDHRYDLTVGVEFPIFTGFNDLYETKKTREQTYAAYETWAELDQEVSLDVLTAYNDVEVAEETFKFSEEFLHFSEQAYELTLESYKVGVSSYTDLLTAQAQLSNARSKRIIAITQYISSLSSLAYAAGILSVSEKVEQIDLQKNLNEIQRDARELK